MVTLAGRHPNFDFSTFDLRDQQLLRGLSTRWFLTSHGQKISIGPKAVFRFFLAKPTEEIAHLMGVDREIIFVIAPYQNFDPRTILVFDRAEQIIGDSLRLDRSFQIILSDDNDVADKIHKLIRENPEYPSTMGLYNAQLSANSINAKIISAFQKLFSIRDVFAYENPIKSEAFFYGRSSIIAEVVSRFEQGQNCALFGLRKSGKTSIIYGVERQLIRKRALSIRIDCQDPDFSRLRWHQALAYIAEHTRKVTQMSLKDFNRDLFTEENATSLFEQEVEKIFKHNKNRPILFMFDEIERISPQKADKDHWRNGSDFVEFWQALRSISQRMKKFTFGYLIVGTAPFVIESRVLNGLENPIFNGAYVQYVAGLDFDAMQALANGLGKLVGLEFSQEVIARLCADFGGIPYLARHALSQINGNLKKERKYRVEKIDYETRYQSFLADGFPYFDMMLGLLKDTYHDEYELLLALAAEDHETVQYYLNADPLFANHLVGFGLVERGEKDLHFRISAIPVYLKRHGRLRKMKPSLEEKWNEVSSRRNRLEVALRKATATTLLMVNGKAKAKQLILETIPTEVRGKFSEIDITELQQGNSCGLYFLNLVTLIEKNWEQIKNLFSEDKNRIKFRLDDINKDRVDAHAKEISDAEFTQLRLHFDELEKQLQFWMTVGK